MKIWISILILLSTCFISTSQDVVLNNYNLSPLQLNPALSGNDCGIRISGNLQFFPNDRSIYNDSYTLNGSVDAPIIMPKRWKLGIGYRYFQDIIGENKLGLKSHLISTSLMKTIETEKINHQFSIGIESGLSTRTLDEKNLRWPSQITSSGFDPSLPGNEPGLQIKIRFFDVNAGLHYRAKWHKKHEINIGIALNHLNTPNISLLGNNQSLKVRPVYYVQSKYMIYPKLGLLPAFYYSNQGNQNVYFVSLGTQYEFTKMKTIATVMGGYQKYKSAFVGAQIKYKRLSIGANYMISNNFLSGKTETFLQYTIDNYACEKD